MTGWWSVAVDAVWILGASIALTAFCYHRWRAWETGRSLRRTLTEPPCRILYVLGITLVGVGGILAQANRWRDPESRDVGSGTRAHLSFPRGVAVDEAGNVYIADTGNDLVRKVTAATGVMTTVAGIGTWGYSGDGGPATAAQLYGPLSVAVDGAGNVYIADAINLRIRKVSAVTGVISTVVGGGAELGDGGPATRAALSFPAGVAVDGAGNLYIADTNHHRIRRVSAATGVITTVAGGGRELGDGGRATSAAIGSPTGVAVDRAGNLFIADASRDRVWMVSAATDAITTIAGGGSGFGDGEAATRAALPNPISVAVDTTGNLYIADHYNERIRKVSVAMGIITTVAGGWYELGDGGAATRAQLTPPRGVAVDEAGNLYILETNSHRIRKVSAATGVIITVAE